MPTPLHPIHLTQDNQDVFIDQVIDLAWSDDVSFDAIKARTGLAEKEVIRIMRRHLKPASFRRWRERVSGRVTKHQKRLRSSQSLPIIED
jgi:uncharacterized protein (TIGR03643 family)